MFAALAHPTRLEAFRLLVRHEPDGLSTGELVAATELTQSTFSTHLAVLSKAGLVGTEKRGRQMIQRARMERLRDLMLFLAKDCCGDARNSARRSSPNSPTADRSRPMPTDIVVYHDPDCGTSRNTLAMIRNAGMEPHVVEYLKTPPSRAMLVQLIERAGLSPRQPLREKGTPFAELGLDDEAIGDNALVDAMMAHPVLINRPLVVTPLGVRLCRPSEAVLDILPEPQRGAFAKEDGEQVIDGAGRRVTAA